MDAWNTRMFMPPAAQKPKKMTIKSEPIAKPIIKTKIKDEVVKVPRQ